MDTEKLKSDLCMQCFKCCKKTYLPLMVTETEDFIFYANKGIEIKRAAGINWAVVYHDCPHLTSTGCDIYAIRPKSCREYDGRRDLFTPDMCLWNTIKEEE